ncbi:MAG: serine/threonine protein kinase [Nigerium sp.]|nr:serine/threonine protein kinase [Nigerium sp.]
MAPRSVAPELPGFSFLGFIGGGGFADVFRYQDALHRTVAVKVTHGVSGESAQAIAAEANLMAKLSSHPNIVSIFQAGVAPDGRTYLVMEECAAAHLGARVSKRLLSVSKAMEITIQLAGAVETAHRLGILHRDIKPANILFTGFQVPALTDFGISASNDGGLASNALSPLWAPPEQHPDSPHPMGPWSDVFSLAATMWAMLVGRSPLEVPGDLNDRLTLRYRAQTFTPPPTRRQDVPDVLERVLATALTADPRQRYQSALEFARALQGVQGQLNESVTAINVLSDEPEDDFDDLGPHETGTRISGFMLIDPHGVDDPSATAGITSPTGGVTSPHDRSGSSQHAEAGPPPASVALHGRGYGQAGLRDFTAPAVPVVGPAVGASATGGFPAAPALAPAKRRRGALAGAVVAVLVIALLGAGGLWFSGALGGENATREPSAAAVSRPPSDPVAARVPPVEDAQGAVIGDEVAFTWANPDPKERDKYVVEELSRPQDVPVLVVDEPTVVVPRQAGQTCLEIRLRRGSGTVSEPVKTCVAS